MAKKIPNAVGGDGAKNGRKTNLQPTNIQGQPFYQQAASRCGSCGTTTPLSGKPGKSISRVTCGSCGHNEPTNGGIDFTFWSLN